MAMIPGILIGIPKPRTKAQKVIAAMKELLAQRHELKVSRKQFLLRWRKLRMALFLTEEYQAFRERVMERCNHVCEKCKCARAVHVHHTKQVVFHPELSLVASLAMGLCTDCHDSEHP